MAELRLITNQIDAPRRKNRGDNRPFHKYISHRAARYLDRSDILNVYFRRRRGTIYGNAAGAAYQTSSGFAEAEDIECVHQNFSDVSLSTEPD